MRTFQKYWIFHRVPLKSPLPQTSNKKHQRLTWKVEGKGIYSNKHERFTTTFIHHISDVLMRIHVKLVIFQIRVMFMKISTSIKETRINGEDYF